VGLQVQLINETPVPAACDAVTPPVKVLFCPAVNAVNDAALDNPVSVLPDFPE
jgi:hypothetical protein